MKGKNFLCFISLFLLVAFLAQAQTRTTGSISGTVVDENGEALPGAAITITGEKLFQKSLSTVSNAKGFFRFMGINPGSYEVEVSLSGFQTVKYSDIKISVGTTAPLQVVMKPATLEEKVMVVGEAPLIETKTPQVSHNFDSFMVENLPNDRSFVDIMNAVPTFMENTGFGASGNVMWGSPAWWMASGSMTGAFKFNDVDVSHPSAGYTTINPLYETIEEVQVVGIGATADYGGFVGGAVNVVTKSGTNAFHGSLTGTYNDKNFYWKRGGSRSGSYAYSLAYDFHTSATFSGPIIKEKLFFFLAGGYLAKKYEYEYISGGVPERSGWKHSRPNYYAKIDYLLNPRNTLTLLWNSNPGQQDNINTANPKSSYFMPSRNHAIYASWLSTLGENAYLSMKFAGYKDLIDMDPYPEYYGLPYSYDYNTYTNLGGWYMDRDTYSQRLQLDGAINYFADNLFGVPHEIKAGFEYENSYEGDRRKMFGFLYIYSAGTDMVRWQGTTGGNADPRSYIKRFCLYVNDSIKISKKIHFNLGLRANFPRFSARGMSGNIASFNLISPRLGLTYDLTGDAKNVFRISYGKYYNKPIALTFSQTLPGREDQYTYQLYTSKAYYESLDLSDIDTVIGVLNDVVAQPANLIGISTYSIPAVADPDLKQAMTTQFSVGFTKMLFRDFAVSIDYLYKNDKNAFELESVREHTYEPVQFTDPWLGNTLTLWRQTDLQPETEKILTNAETAYKRHHILIFQIKKRPSHNWSMNFSYTYQTNKTNYPGMHSSDLFGGGLNNFDTDPYYQEPLFTGKEWCRPHQFKINLSWYAPFGIIVGLDGRYMSENVGEANLYYFQLPSNLLSYFFRTISGSYITRVYLEPIGSRTGRLYKCFDVRIAKSFKIMGSHLELRADIFNIFNDDYSYFMSWFTYLTNPDLPRKSGGLLTPRNWRIGVTWRF